MDELPVDWRGSMETKPWSVLAYLVGHDKADLHPLDRAAQNEIKAICRAANLDKTNVALHVAFKRMPGAFRATVQPRDEQGLSFGFDPFDPERNTFWGQVLNDVPQCDLNLERDRRYLDTASEDVLHDFLSYGREKFPASRYLIFFYGHAFGPMGLFFDSERNQDAHPLRLTDLARAIASSPHEPAEIIMFRDCFVNTLEMAFELHGVARYMIASQSGVPIAGLWPWPSFLSVLTMASGDSGEAARALALQLAHHFEQKENRGGDIDVPIGLIDIEAALKVVGPLATLVDLLDASRSDTPRRKAYAAAIDRARIGKNPAKQGDAALVDIPTMCHNLLETDDARVVEAAREVGKVVTKEVVKYSYSVHGRFHGLSIYCKPGTQKLKDRSFIEAGSDEDAEVDAAYYQTLALSQATGWDRIALDPL